MNKGIEFSPARVIRAQVSCLDTLNLPYERKRDLANAALLCALSLNNNSRPETSDDSYVVGKEEIVVRALTNLLRAEFTVKAK